MHCTVYKRLCCYTIKNDCTAKRPIQESSEIPLHALITPKLGMN